MLFWVCLGNQTTNYFRSKRALIRTAVTVSFYLRTPSCTLTVHSICYRFSLVFCHSFCLLPKLEYNFICMTHKVRKPNYVFMMVCIDSI
jgi:hypothetical protein